MRRSLAVSVLAATCLAGAVPPAAAATGPAAPAAAVAGSAPAPSGPVFRSGALVRPAGPVVQAPPADRVAARSSLRGPALRRVLRAQRTADEVLPGWRVARSG